MAGLVPAIRIVAPLFPAGGLLSKVFCRGASGTVCRVKPGHDEVERGRTIPP
jgi:hypothetical protein